MATTTHTPRRLALAPLLLLAAGCGGPLLFAELEVPEVGLTVAQQTFPASGADPSFWCSLQQARGEECLRVEMTYDLGEEIELLTEDDVDYDIRLTGLSLRLASTSGGAADLGGVQRVSVSVVPPGGGAAVQVASYRRDDAAPAPTQVSVTGNSNLDLAPFLEAGKVTLRLELSVDDATPEFTADVMGVFYVRVRLDYGAAVGL